MTSSIPFDSEAKHHWWKRGQSVEQTLEHTLEQNRAEVVAYLEAERADQTVMQE